MKPHVLVISALFLFAATGAAAETGEAPFRADSRLVLVPVTVTDRHAKTVEGLRAEDFTVLDNQAPQQIISFGTDDAPSSVSIVLDISGSMQKALAAAKEMLKTFFAASNPDDDFLMLTVSTQPSAAPKFTSDTGALTESIGSARPGGLTSLLDTAYLGLLRMKEARQPRRAMIILSDGFDNHSRYSQGELMSLALEADVQVYSMIFDTGLPESNSVPFVSPMVAKPWVLARMRQGPDFLEKLSAKTGGLSFHVRNDAEAREALGKTSQALRTEYLIGYQPSESGAPGKWHQIRVKSGVPKVYVHARNGYYSR